MAGPKKFQYLVFIFLITATVTTVSAGEVLFQEIPKPEDVFGNAWFPLYVGAMWKWKMEESDNEAELQWTIVNAKLVTDSDNNLDKVIAWQLQMNSITDALYFIEHDGFICTYEKKRTGYTLTKLLPILARSQQRWQSGTDSYTIPAIDDETLKTEYVSDDGSRYGYQVFGKGIGPVEFFDYTSSEFGSNAVKWTLIDYKSYSDVVVERYNTMSDTDDMVMEEIDDVDNSLAYGTTSSTSSTTTTTTTIAMTTTTTTTMPEEDTVVYIDEYYESEKDTSKGSSGERDSRDREMGEVIRNMSTQKTYIQAGSFNVYRYAILMAGSLKDNGYMVNILEEDDFTWKVLIVVDKEDEARILQRVRKEIEPGAFVRQRAK
jgi:hypothetical protein